MRELKFRAWFDNEMLLNEKLIKMDQETHAMYTIITNDKKEDEVSIMQYTGLKDKNGVEIYEGDILLGEIFKGLEQNYVVKYDTSTVRYYLDDCSGRDTRTYFTQNSRVTVIGNIYEHPHLLEVTS